jgi:probable rRNA maturation factor
MSSDGSPLFFRAVPTHLQLGAEEKRRLRSFVRDLSERIGAGRPFSCVITNDKRLQELNRQFLNHNYPTDVLSFPQPNGSDELGEMAISIERADVQAQQYGHPLMDELRILILHGVLHLTGMDHERDRGEMARAERRFRKELGLRDGLIARSKK